MPKKKALDAAKLIEMVEAETPSAEIMKKMGSRPPPAQDRVYKRSDRGGEGSGHQGWARGR